MKISPKISQDFVGGMDELNHESVQSRAVQQVDVSHFDTSNLLANSTSDTSVIIVSQNVGISIYI